MKTEKMMNTLEKLRLRVDNLMKSISSSIDVCRNDLINISKILQVVHESHSGSWIGYQANLYFDDFKKPTANNTFNAYFGGLFGMPLGWVDKSREDIESFVNQNHRGPSIADIRNTLIKHANSARQIQTELCTELSIIRGIKSYVQELKFLDEIENIKWGIPSDNYIKELRPSQMVSGDTRAVSQGFWTPPHIEYLARVYYCISIISDIERFANTAQRLIRQIEIKLSANIDTSDMPNSLTKVLHLCKRFHPIAKQMTNRHDNRDSLLIHDEYDVQDMLHALLRVYFDDIRPEEWTPSYAGQSTRMDFLLKSEEIVIETKMTNEKLRDKEIGNQLIIDIAHYKQHPNCRTLVCFVYDVAGLIGNPRGLEKDLNQTSTDDIQVIVVIEPF